MPTARELHLQISECVNVSAAFLCVLCVNGQVMPAIVEPFLALKW